MNRPKRAVASSLEPTQRFKKRDGSLNENFNLNVIKSKYKGLENFLEDTYTRKHGHATRFLNSTAMASAKRSWLN